jgi:hypothetical protein
MPTALERKPAMTAYTFPEDLAICLLWQLNGSKRLQPDDTRVVALAAEIPHSAASISMKTGDYDSIHRPDLVLTTGGKVPQTMRAYELVQSWQH